MKTADLIGPALDWAVAKCEGITVEINSVAVVQERRLKSMTREEAATLPPPSPYLVIAGKGCAEFSTNWAQGGPIIEREKINVTLNTEYNDNWCAEPHGMDSICQRKHGPTPLIAAMRCRVAATLGDTIELPKELQ